MSSPITSGITTVSDGAEASNLAYAYDAAVYQRFAFLATKVALAVTQEDPGTTGHANRASRALQYLLNCQSAATQLQMTLICMADLSITHTSTSQAIADKFADLWDVISGNDITPTGTVGPTTP